MFRDSPLSRENSAALSMTAFLWGKSTGRIETGGGFAGVGVRAAGA